MILSKLTGVPYILDYRDHWSLCTYIDFSSRIHQKLASIIEKKMLKQASYVTVIGETMKAQLLEAFPENREGKFHVMYNGYDEYDFKDKSLSENKEGVLFSYVGNFLWKSDSKIPNRSH